MDCSRSRASGCGVPLAAGAHFECRAMRHSPRKRLRRSPGCGGGHCPIAQTLRREQRQQSRARSPVSGANPLARCDGVQITPAAVPVGFSSRWRSGRRPDANGSPGDRRATGPAARHRARRRIPCKRFPTRPRVDALHAAAARAYGFLGGATARWCRTIRHLRSARDAEHHAPGECVQSATFATLRDLGRSGPWARNAAVDSVRWVAWRDEPPTTRAVAT
jgi:hypothetical protein